MTADGSSDPRTLRSFPLHLEECGEGVDCLTICPIRLRERPPRARLRRAGAALGLGLLAALAGSILYFTVAVITGREFGLIALAVGFVVGSAVRKGAGERGGWQYQGLAAVLTYLAIVSTYVPGIAKKIQDLPSRTKPPIVAASHNESAPLAMADTALPVSQAGIPVSAIRSSNALAQRHLGAGTMVLGFLELLLYASIEPVAAGFSNLIGLVIIGVGVFVAGWINRRSGFPIGEPSRIWDDNEDAAAA